MAQPRNNLRSVSSPPPASVETRRNEIQLAVTQEQIARRAYELFLERGGEFGHEQEDWFRAERELRQRST